MVGNRSINQARFVIAADHLHRYAQYFLRCLQEALRVLCLPQRVGTFNNKALCRYRRQSLRKSAQAGKATLLSILGQTIIFKPTEQLDLFLKPLVHNKTGTMGLHDQQMETV